MNVARPHSKPPRGRRRGQAIVEFGLVALLFTLLLMGTVDFAILLNGWLGVSSSARDIARQLAVGLCPSSAPTSGAGSKYCVNGLVGKVPNVPNPSGLQIQGVDRSLPASQQVTVSISVCAPQSTCSSPVAYTGNDLNIIYPTGNCDMQTGTNCSATIHPTNNDAIVVTVVAQIQVITPLVRPFFGCTNGSNPRCDVSITSRAVARFEGPYI